ncbi:hypothetical protein ACFRAE_14300 [Sphingobacterium sp. HJSM2_6]|uniref:hypothetical protein n=1 Tax=Sphingobacterium sp. HJSM2_6 TaxID=3366264 RepID=UPI003BE96BC4
MIKNIRFSLFTLFSLSTALFFASCDKDMAISLKNDNIDNLNVTSIDSLNAVVSTVQLPNIPSAGQGMLLVGKVAQPTIGSLEVNTYFRLIQSSLTNDIPAGASFDSINLVIKPNLQRYAYGDTSKFQTIYAHRLTENLETKTLGSSVTGQPNPVYYPGATIFAHQSFAYEAAPIGSIRFLPHMRRTDSLSIKLSNTIGADMFNKIKTADMTFNSVANFQEYFKGITLRTDENNTAVVGFKDTLQVNINYSYLGSDGFKKKGSKSLNMGNKVFQYNQFISDRSGTDFAALTAQSPIRVEDTDGLSFVQAGTGVATKIDFPSLKAFMQQTGIAINRAELEIEIESSHLGYYAAAPIPILLIADENNIPVNYVTIPFSNAIQTGTYILGNNTGKPGKYRFNMIQYIRSTLTGTEDKQSLILSLASPSLFNTVNTSILATENNKPKIKLNIVYTKFK